MPRPRFGSSPRKLLTTLGGTSQESDEDEIGHRQTSQSSFASAAEWLMPMDMVHKPVFQDILQMKEKVRLALTRPEHNVCNLYHEEGIWQAIARHRIFEMLTLAVIAFNAIWISIDTDYNDATVLYQAHPIFQIAENFFCFYFSFEWFVRFMSFERKISGLRDTWFVFDSALVFMMVVETWVMTFVLLAFVGGGDGGGGAGLGDASILRMARLLRLTRMARMARLLRAMPELLILIKGMVAAGRSVFFTLCLLIIILYVFGIAFRQLTADSELGKELFPSVADSMYVLLLAGTFMDDITTVATAVGKGSPAFAALFFLFVLLSSCTVMNMLIGVICEVVSAVAATEKETMTIATVKGKLQEIVTSLDEDEDQMISKQEFAGILQNPGAAMTLQDVGVDVVNLLDFTDAIFENFKGKHGEFQVKFQAVDDEDEQITFSHFMEEILRLRGSNGATVKDVVDLQKYVKRLATELKMQAEQHRARLEDRMQDIFLQVHRCSRALGVHEADNEDRKQRPRWSRSSTNELCGGKRVKDRRGSAPQLSVLRRARTMDLKKPVEDVSLGAQTSPEPSGDEKKSIARKLQHPLELGEIDLEVSAARKGALQTILPAAAMVRESSSKPCKGGDESPLQQARGATPPNELQLPTPQVDAPGHVDGESAPRNELFHGATQELDEARGRTPSRCDSETLRQLDSASDLRDVNTKIWRGRSSSPPSRVSAGPAAREARDGPASPPPVATRKLMTPPPRETWCGRSASLPRQMWFQQELARSPGSLAPRSTTSPRREPESELGISTELALLAPDILRPHSVDAWHRRALPSHGLHHGLGLPSHGEPHGAWTGPVAAQAAPRECSPAWSRHAVSRHGPCEPRPTSRPTKAQRAAEDVTRLSMPSVDATGMRGTGHLDVASLPSLTLERRLR